MHLLKGNNLVILRIKDSSRGKELHHTLFIYGPKRVQNPEGLVICALWEEAKSPLNLLGWNMPAHDVVETNPGCLIAADKYLPNIWVRDRLKALHA